MRSFRLPSIGAANICTASFIHGAAYGIPHLGGIVFLEDARRVPLSRFRLHSGERFSYEYDFTADWKLDIRLERALSLDPNRALSSCVGGSRAAPPEDCAGALDYLKRLDWHRPELLYLEVRWASLIPTGAWLDCWRMCCR